MTRRIWLAVCLVAVANFTLAWLNWMTLSFFINLPDQHQTVFYAATAMCFGVFLVAYGRAWRDWSIPPLAAFLGTTVFTFVGVISGSFAARDVSVWTVLAYTWFETVLALACGLAGIAMGRGLYRLGVLRPAT